MSEHIVHDHQHDGIDRRGFLRCMAWAGTGVILGVVGDRIVTTALGDVLQGKAAAPAADFSFVQISDSHIGFHQQANKNVIGTFEEAVRRINALPQRPAFVMHTGDHVHLSTMDEFDTVKQIMGTIKTDRTFNVPGEHDVFVDQGKRYLRVFGQGAQGTGYYSFEYKGVHFLALANVEQAEAENAGLSGLGRLGPAQLDFVKKDLAALSSDTPLVLFSHVPLLAIYPSWGWATEDSTQVLALVKRFSSVTALNGHIHQIISKTEDNIVMHTAASTAYPLHPPGQVAPSPLVVPAGVLPSRIGIRTVQFVRGNSSLALKDESFA
jgi:3',5'-cyclic AMP phosphodiesterase CpdA